MTIRKSLPKDYDAIENVLCLAFGGEDEVMLIRGLREDGDITLELVHETNGEIDGHILFSAMRAPIRTLALAPLSVLPDKQKKGIGKSLTQAALEQIRPECWQAVFVLGDPNYYQSFGFSRELAKPFLSPYAGEYFMALELEQGCLSNLSGEVIHAPTFSRVEG